MVAWLIFLEKQWGSGFQRLNIRCARIEGVELPNKKRIETALQSIHGVGKTTARQILLTIGLENKVTSELSELELTKIREELSNYMIEGKLVSPSTLFILFYLLFLISRKNWLDYRCFPASFASSSSSSFCMP